MRTNVRLVPAIEVAAAIALFAATLSLDRAATAVTPACRAG
jgi:hypothetical protein